MPMITEFTRVVIYYEGLPTINLHDLSMRWPCEVT